MPTLQTLLSNSPSEELNALINEQQQLDRPPESSIFRKFIDRKSDWRPAQYQQQMIPESRHNYDDAVLKGLAVALALEIPVGEYTLAASKKEFIVPEKWALIENAKDEVVHFQALKNFVTSLPIKQQNQLESYTKEALNFADQISASKENEIVKSGYIELGAFLVTLSILRKFGNSALKLLVTNISKDESVHVQTNWRIIDNNQIPYQFSDLNNIRRDMVGWITEGIISKKWGKDYWLTQSDNLISKRQSEGLAWTKAATYTAFFEVSNASLSSY